MRISDFKAVMNSYGGLARTNLFLVELSPINQINSDTRDLRFFCKSAMVPGINFNVSEHRPNAIGLPDFIPISMTTSQVNCIFMLDDNHQVLSFFHRWMRAMMNFNTANGHAEGVDGLIPFELAYPNDYFMNMTIKHFSTHSTNYYKTVLRNVFPTEVSAVNLSWEDDAQVATITVNFAYNAIDFQGAQVSTVPTELSRGKHGKDFYSSIGSTVIPVEKFQGVRNTLDAINRLVASNGNLLTYL